MSVAPGRVLLPFLPFRQVRAIAALWAIWSATVLALAWLAMLLPVETSSPWTAVAHAPPLARWDAVWYRSIALEGYHLAGAGRDANVGWYPLYPLVVRGAAALFHLPILPAGISVSLFFLLAALLVCADLFSEWGGEGAALPAAAAMLLFPTSFYLASVYTESLFLFSAAAAIWGSRRGRWSIAALGGLAAALTRLNGALLALPIGWYALRAKRESRARALAASTAPLLGAVVFPFYLWRRFGDPLLYLHNRVAGSSVRPQPVWTLAAKLAREIRARALEPARMDNLSFASQLLCAVLFTVLTVALFRRGLTAEGIYAAGMLLLLFHSGTLDGWDRYALTLFPCFFVLSELVRRRPVLAFAYVLAGVGIGTTFLHRFVHWIMVS